MLQLKCIFKVLGTPGEEYKNLPGGVRGLKWKGKEGEVRVYLCMLFVLYNNVPYVCNIAAANFFGESNILFYFAT